MATRLPHGNTNVSNAVTCVELFERLGSVESNSVHGQFLAYAVSSTHSLGASLCVSDAADELETRGMREAVIGAVMGLCSLDVGGA